LLLANKLTAAQKMHHKLTGLFKSCFVETNPIPVKAGLAQLGLITNVLRPPLYPATDDTVHLMTEVLQQLKIKL
jgi:4-hydroxy-tetrahydrodipicolinate synthase